MKEKLSILTLNTGLSKLKLGPFWFDLVAKVDDRQRQLAQELRLKNVDIVCLQEVYERENEAQLRNELIDLYPFQYFSQKEWKLFGHGLVILSKYPFDVIEELSFRTKGFETIATKGGVVVKFVDGVVKDIVLANAHFPYGGFGSKSQTSRSAIGMRNKDIAILDDLARKYSDKIIIAGDFNFGPDMAKENYERVLSRGYVNSTDEMVTWIPENPLNRMFPGAVRQSIDHIFLSEKIMEYFECEREYLLFDRPLKVNGDEFFLSDHFGIQIILGC